MPSFQNKGGKKLNLRKYAKYLSMGITRMITSLTSRYITNRATILQIYVNVSYSTRFFSLSTS